MGGTKMTKKGKRILGVIMGAAVMMAAAGCGQSADSGTKGCTRGKGIRKQRGECRFRPGRICRGSDRNH